MKKYLTYDEYLKTRFGTKVMKLPLDAGFTCPNIDGRCGFGGCTYCSKQPLRYRGLPIAAQAEEAKRILRKKWVREGREEKYIPYFQVFSNTYAPVELLRELYSQALAVPGVVGLSIATRADCLPPEVVELLFEFSEKTYLTVELGLQTVHEDTARLIHRGHSFEDFLRGYEALKGLNVCIHLINGLPGESRERMLTSAQTVASLRPHEIKLHMLYLEKGCELTRQYEETPFPLLSLEEYCEIVVSQLEFFHPDTVVGRVTGDGSAEALVAPLWTLKKFSVLNGIDKEFERRQTWQGRRFGES